MAHWLAISIGPVQDFIASARRFRDLWFGSWLLTEIAAAAARQLCTEGGTLIFPAPESLDDPDGAGGIANKLVASVDGDPSEIAQKVEEAARKQLSAIAKDAFARLLGQSAFDAETAHKQIQDLLEFHWVAVPATADYAADRNLAEAWLAARKNTRDFQPVSWGSNRPKSSLDGHREAVIDPECFEKKSERAIFRQFGLRKGENLCGVGLLKRHGGDTLSVPSTAHMAALSMLADLEPSLVRPAAQTLIDDLAALDLEETVYRRRPGKFEGPTDLGNLHGQIFFEERLKDALEDAPDLFLGAQRAVRKFLGVVKAQRPLPYYALLQADGDKMGEAIDRQRAPEQHAKLSRTLASFVAAAGELVKQHQGFLIYAGGDDVLALLPLQTALPCARALAHDFKTKLAPFGGPESVPTLSVGIAIGHQMDPAGETRDRAKRAESLAKQSRNALGLVIKKRGGSEQQLAGTWGTLDARLDDWIALHRQDALPDGAAYELRDLARSLGKDAPEGAYKLETARILGRKRIRDREFVSDEVQARLVARAVNAKNLYDLAEELIAARLFATGQDS